MVKLVDNYTLTTYLGKGEYGKVFRAYHMDTKMEVAVKMVPLDKFIEVGKLSELTRNEIETLRALEKNLNVVKFVEMIKTNNYVYLVY